MDSDEDGEKDGQKRYEKSKGRQERGRERDGRGICRCCDYCHRAREGNLV
jgi:hypothetical protein